MEALSRTAARLRPWLVRGKPLPNLLFFTDPERTPDPERVAERLPAGAAVVFRAFGAPDAAARGRGCARSPAGAACGCWSGRMRPGLGDRGRRPSPARAAGRPGAEPARKTHPDWLITLAAHDLAAALAGAAAGRTPWWCRRSSQPQPFGGRAAGRGGLKRIVEAVETPVYALGGVRADTARACWTRELSGSRRWRR
jgi:thiamine-phosphate pyrophosphorylase